MGQIGIWPSGPECWFFLASHSHAGVHKMQVVFKDNSRLDVAQQVKLLLGMSVFCILSA